MIKPASEFIAEAQQNCKCINPTQAKNMLNYNDSLIVIDVREPAEAQEKKLNCSINIPRGLLEMKTPTQCPNHETTILVHCAAGGRASLAAVRLNEMGYKNVYAITAKFDDIKKAFD